MYPPVNNQHAYGETKIHEVSSNVGEKGLWLPSQVNLSNEEIDKICYVIKDFYK